MKSTSTIIKLTALVKNWESKGNKVSDSAMFYYCPWFTGKKDNQ